MEPAPGENMKLNYMYEMNTRQIQEVARKTDVVFFLWAPRKSIPSIFP